MFFYETHLGLNVAFACAPPQQPNLTPATANQNVNFVVDVQLGTITFSLIH